VITDNSPNSKIGYIFTVGSSDISVFSLGLWDDNSDGFSDSHDVGLWSGSVLLGNVTIPSGPSDTQIGGFQYVALALPLILPSNEAFVIKASGFSGSIDAFHNSFGSGPVFSGDIASAVSLYQSDVWGSPLTVIGGTPFVGPSFQYNAVPEPSSIMLLLISVGIITMKILVSRKNRPNRLVQLIAGRQEFR